MEYLKNPQWWSTATTRAIKTFAQTFVATTGSSMVLTDVNWKVVISASLLAMILSYMTSLAGLPELDNEDGEGYE